MHIIATDTDGRVSLRLEFTNEFGSNFVQETTRKVNYDVGETEMLFFGEYINNFLRQIGYFRSNDYMLMEDLTEDELDAVTDFLIDYRKQSENND